MKTNKKSQEKKAEPITEDVIRDFRRQYTKGFFFLWDDRSSSLLVSRSKEDLVEEIFDLVKEIEDEKSKEKYHKKKEKNEDITYHIKLFEKSIEVARLWQQLRSLCEEEEPPSRRKNKRALKMIRDKNSRLQDHNPDDSQEPVDPERLDKYVKLLEIIREEKARWLQYSGFPSHRFYNLNRDERSNLIDLCIWAEEEEEKEIEKLKQETGSRNSIKVVEVKKKDSINKKTIPVNPGIQQASSKKIGRDAVDEEKEKQASFTKIGRDAVYKEEKEKQASSKKQERDAVDEEEEEEEPEKKTILGKTLSVDDGNISDITIQNCMKWCNNEAAKTVIPVIFFDPITFSSAFSEEKIVGDLDENYFAGKNFTPMTAKYLFIPVHDKKRDHWLSLLVDLHSKAMYSFDSLMATPDKKDIVINSSMRNATDAVVRYAKIVCIVYNNYMEKAREQYQLKQQNKCAFRLFSRMFIEKQKGRTCGLYPMGIAYQMVTQDEGIEDLFDNLASHDYKYDLSRNMVKSLRSHLKEMFESPLRPSENEMYMDAYIRVFYKVWNCFTYEGSRQIDLYITPVSSCREFEELKKIFESIRKYFNTKSEEACKEYSNPSKGLVESPFPIRIANGGIVRDGLPIIALSISKRCDNTGKYPYIVRVNNNLLEFGTRFFDEKLDSENNYYNGLV